MTYFLIFSENEVCYISYPVGKLLKFVLYFLILFHIFENINIWLKKSVFKIPCFLLSYIFNLKLSERLIYLLIKIIFITKVNHVHHENN